MKKMIAVFLLLFIACLMLQLVTNRLNAQGPYFIDNYKALQRVVNVASATQTYVGEAGTKTNFNESKWRILLVQKNGEDLYVQYAAYSEEFDKNWNLRKTYNYGVAPQ